MCYFCEKNMSFNEVGILSGKQECDIKKNDPPEKVDRSIQKPFGMALFKETFDIPFCFTGNLDYPFVSVLCSFFSGQYLNMSDLFNGD